MTAATQPSTVPKGAWADLTDSETAEFIPRLLRHALCTFVVRRWRASLKGTMAFYNRLYAELEAGSQEVKDLPDSTVRSLLLPNAALDAWNNISAAATNKIAKFVTFGFLLAAAVALSLLNQPPPWKSIAHFGVFAAMAIGTVALSAMVLFLVSTLISLVDYIFAPASLTQRLPIFVAIVCALCVAFYYWSSNSSFSIAVCAASVVLLFLFVGYPPPPYMRKHSLVRNLTINGVFAIAIVVAAFAGKSGALVDDGVIATAIVLTVLTTISASHGVLLVLRVRYYRRTYPQGALVYCLLFAGAALRATKGPVYSSGQIQGISGLINAAAGIVERDLLRTSDFADPILRLNVDRELRHRATKLREVAVTVATPTEKQLEGVYSTVVKSLVDSVYGQWGALESATDAPLVPLDRKERILGAIRRGLVVALLAVAIYLLQTIKAVWLTDAFRGPATAALAVFAFQLILSQIDPTAAGVSGEVITSVAKQIGSGRE